MDFKRPEVAFQIRSCHAAIRAILVELEAWSIREDLPVPFVVRLFATEDDQRSILALPPGAPIPFSYHYVGCAADLGLRSYTPDQAARVVAWLRQNWPPPRYDVIDKLHGTGPHIHIEVNATDIARAWKTNT